MNTTPEPELRLSRDEFTARRRELNDHPEIARHQSSLVTKQRRKVARRVVADKRARGEQVGNPEALAAHRRKGKKKATR